MQLGFECRVDSQSSTLVGFESPWRYQLNTMQGIDLVTW